MGEAGGVEVHELVVSKDEAMAQLRGFATAGEGSGQPHRAQRRTVVRDHVQAAFAPRHSQDLVCREQRPGLDDHARVRLVPTAVWRAGWAGRLQGCLGMHYDRGCVLQTLPGRRDAAAEGADGEREDPEHAGRPHRRRPGPRGRRVCLELPEARLGGFDVVAIGRHKR